MKNLIFSGTLVFTLMIPVLILAQVNNSELPTSIRADGLAPDSSAMLDVQSVDKGVLFSRMDSVQRVSIVNPATGLLIYQTDKKAGFYFYDGDAWIPIHGELGASELLGHDPTPDFSCLQIAGNLSIGYSEALDVLNDLVYVADGGSDSLKVIDVSKPAIPKLIGGLTIGTHPSSVVVSGNYAYVVDRGTDDLKVIDVSNASNPVLIGSLALGPTPQSIDVLGNYACVVDLSSNDLKVIDVTNPTSPVLRGSLAIGSSPSSVVAINDHAFVVDAGSDDLKIIDVSNPDTPILIGSLAIGSAPQSIVVLDGYAYVVDSESDDLKVIDISNPNSPVVTGSLPLGPHPISIDILNDHAYVVDYIDSDLKVIDVSDPVGPLLREVLDISFNPNQLVISGDYAYVVYNTNDFSVIFAGDCGDPTLTINPFNGVLKEGPPITPNFWAQNGQDIYSINSTDVGIGTSSPANKLDVEGNLAVGSTYSGSISAPDDGAIIEGSVGIGTSNPANKFDIQMEQRTGSHPTDLSLYVTGDMNAQSDGIEFRHSNGTQGIGFGFNTIYATGNNTDQDLNLRSRGSGDLKLNVDGNDAIHIEGNNGRVGIGNNTPASPLSILGSVYDGYICRLESDMISFHYRGLKIRAGNDNNSANFIDFYHGSDAQVGSITWNGTNTLYNATSDRRLKKDIVETQKDALAILGDLRVVDYKMKDGDGSVGTGYIAQEALEAFPEMVSYDEENDMYSVGSNLLIPILHKAIQEQQEIIELQQKQIDRLIEDIQKLNQ